MRLHKYGETPSSMPPKRLRVVIAEDHDLMVAALGRVLSERDDIEIVGQARKGDEVVPLVLETEPDVVLLDIGMPGTDGIECARQLRGRLPRLRIMMLTAYGDADSVQAAERAGANGFILKSVGGPELMELLEAHAGDEFVVAGFPEQDPCAAELTARERVVLQAVAEGLTNREIGTALWITEETVKFHLKNLYRKLGVSTRAEVMRRAHDRGLLWSGPRPTRTAG
jgi:DNA-binding NarL/FixJ family response regulator